MFLVKCAQCSKCEGEQNGVTFYRMEYDGTPLIDTPEENLAGPWYSFRLRGQETRRLLRNVEDVEDYLLVVDRSSPSKRRVAFRYEDLLDDKPVNLLLLTEIVYSRTSPVVYCNLGLRNDSIVTLDEFTTYMILDFDVGGFFAHANDVGVYRVLEGDGGKNVHVMIQEDDSNFFAGFCSPVPPSSYQVFDPTQFAKGDLPPELTNRDRLGPGDVGLAMAWKTNALAPEETFIVPVLLFGGNKKQMTLEDLIRSTCPRVEPLLSKFKTWTTRQG